VLFFANELEVVVYAHAIIQGFKEKDYTYEEIEVILKRVLK